MKKQSTGMLVLLVCSMLLVGLFAGAVFFPTEKVVVKTELKEVPYVVEVASNNSDSRLTKAVDEILESLDVEAFAEEFALEELESNDFMEAVFDALLSFGEDVDDEEDVYKYVVKDLNVAVSGDEADVEFSVKVYYYVDGDEEESEKALLEDFTMHLDNLDVSDDFEDAEADEGYLSTLTINKVY